MKLVVEKESGVRTGGERVVVVVAAVIHDGKRW